MSLQGTRSAEHGRMERPTHPGSDKRSPKDRNAMVRGHKMEAAQTETDGGMMFVITSLLHPQP